MDPESLELLTDALRKTMGAVSGHQLDEALAELGWQEMLDEMPDVAIPLVFRLLGETGAHAAVINDVVLRAARRPPNATVPLPFTGGAWVMWDRTDQPTGVLDPELPLHRVRPPTDQVPLDAGRRALGWWLTGTARAMLALARRHALERVQFGHQLASFQAVRHRLAETLVAIEGAEATLAAGSDEPLARRAESSDEPLARRAEESDEPLARRAEESEELAAALAKAAAGQAALTAARHCQQVLGGIGFTAEHDLHRHVRRTLVLDGLLGSSRELTRQAGAILRERGSAPRLVFL